MKKIRIIFLCFFTVFFGELSAQSSFYEIIESVLDNDKEIRAQEATGEASVSYNEIGGPQIDYEHIWPKDGEEPQGRWSIAVSQDFEYPGIYSARGKVASYERENASLVLMAVKMDKALAAKMLIIDIINSHRRLELYSEISRNINLVDSLIHKAYDEGSATSLDLWKMQLAVLENRHSIAMQEGDIRALEGALAATGAEFINGEAEFWHDYPMQMLVSPEEGLKNSLTEAVMRNNANLGKARVRAMKMEAIPTFSAGFKHNYEEHRHFNGFVVSMTLPSFSQKKKNRIAMLEAEAVDFASSYEVDRQRAEMNALYEEAIAVEKALNSYRSLTGDQTYLRLLDKSFKAGQLTVIDYLNEINLFVEARLGFLDLEYRYNLALAKLNRYRSLDF